MVLSDLLLYSIFAAMKDLDAMLASLKIGIPTLNGYSECAPYGRYRIVKYDGVTKLFTEISKLDSEANLTRVALIGGICD
jgi:hypothetical protein